MKNKIKIITFYLPQYHPIPENDKWWGKGFTDWRNVVKSKPRYVGHYQPQLPADLGFYDLRNEETRIAQAELAKEYDINAFCYYHYWFNGKMLLEKPFNEVLKSGKPNFPFCLCWANENWSRRWDGLDSEILIKQDFDNYNLDEHISWLNKAFIDDRYIKVNNNPIFLIYNASGIPNLERFIKQFRDKLKSFDFKDVYLCSVKSIHNRLKDSEAINVGFNAVVEFIPGSEFIYPRKLFGLPKYYFYKLFNIFIEATKLDKWINTLPLTIIHDYKKLSSLYMKKTVSKVKTFPVVIPSWDNSSRKKNSASIQNNDPELFRNWLTNAVQKVQDYENDERIVFLNAWNEWAEGCHLEPDLKNGKKFLEVIKNVINNLN
ncbi:MAG: glycoside hydrolase family 99-like domain-containing protein [Ignavibacteria bacterium]|nr:glycoside hydrolase family 99-like domain-containing protein [Ignavibacteria bacterium]